jgi:hypothetical protein
VRLVCFLSTFSEVLVAVSGVAFYVV